MPTRFIRTAAFGVALLSSASIATAAERCSAVSPALLRPDWPGWCCCTVVNSDCSFKPTGPPPAPPITSGASVLGHSSL